MDIKKPDSGPKTGLSQKVSARLSYITASGVKPEIIKSTDEPADGLQATPLHHHPAGRHLPSWFRTKGKPACETATKRRSLPHAGDRMGL